MVVGGGGGGMTSATSRGRKYVKLSEKIFKASFLSANPLFVRICLLDSNIDYKLSEKIFTIFHRFPASGHQNKEYFVNNM